jgi:hypothetical protein
MFGSGCLLVFVRFAIIRVDIGQHEISCSVLLKRLQNDLVQYIGAFELFCEFKNKS